MIKHNIMSVSLIFLSACAFGAEYTMFGKQFDVHATASQGYLKSDKNNFLADTEEGTFEFNEYAFNIYSDLNDRLSVTAQVLGRDFGEYGNNEPELNWAFASYYLSEYASVRAGKLKMAYGLQNEYRDMDLLRTSVLLPQSVYNETWRDTATAIWGASVYGQFDVSSLGKLDYQFIYADSVNLDTDSGLTKYINNYVYIDTRDIDLSDTVNFKLKWDTPAEGLSANYTYTAFDLKMLSCTVGNFFWQAVDYQLSSVLGAAVHITDVEFAINIESNVYSLQYKWNNLTLIAEYMLVDMDDYRLTAVNLPSEITLVDKTSQMEGYYAGASWRFNPSFEVAAAYSVFYPGREDKNGEGLQRDSGAPKSGGWLKDVILSGRYDINLNWIFKLELHLMDGNAVMLMEDNLDGSGRLDMEKDWYLVASKVTFNY